MAFRSANLAAHMMKFNSAASSDFLDLYTKMIDDEITNSKSGPVHKTFAPSQMRCDRVSWFRLRGTAPDVIKTPDRTLNFTAEIGTACHEVIQERLSRNLHSDWISVHEWVAKHHEFFSEYDMDITGRNIYESQIELRKPYPVRFACDGIVRINGKVYLLEIKTSEFASMNDLTAPKPKHLDQIKCYATLLHIPNVLFLYVDRTYGDMKCFEVTVDDNEQEAVRKKMDRVMELVEANIAPEGLPVGDPDCSQNMCRYYKVCRQWGR